MRVLGTHEPSIRPRTSRALHRVHDVTTRPLIAIVVGGGVVAAWIVVAITGFDEGIQFGFATACAGVTVTMVFMLQHAQHKERVALQLKLDEIVRALPHADDRLIAVEASTDDELGQMQQGHLDEHAALRDAGRA
jgi:low affinity Fe/Cu permease